MGKVGVMQRGWIKSDSLGVRGWKGMGKVGVMQRIWIKSDSLGVRGRKVRSEGGYVVELN